MAGAMEEVVLYVVRDEGQSWRLAGTRVSLDSVVHAYREGLSPEAIVDDFPSLSPEQVHEATAFYLHHREEVERDLAEQEGRWEPFRKQSEAANADILNRLRAAKRRSADEMRPG